MSIDRLPPPMSHRKGVLLALGAVAGMVLLLSVDPYAVGVELYLLTWPAAARWMLAIAQ